jgi:hypothetical protein
MTIITISMLFVFSGPPGYPFIGNFFDFIKCRTNSLPVFVKWAQIYGPTYRFRVIGDRVIQQVMHGLGRDFHCYIHI